MTNYEYIRNIGPEKLANYLCDVMDKLSQEIDRDSCYVCPLYDRCDYNTNAWLEWLKEDYGKEKEQT